MSSQLLVVGVALLVEPFELDDVSSCVGQALGVVFHPLSDGVASPKAVARMVALRVGSRVRIVSADVGETSR